MTDYSLWERLARKNELKAHGTLLMALPNKNQLKFNIHKDAKTLIKAIEKRFGENKETKKKLISQLEILGESLSQEDINLKFLRRLPAEWRTHNLIWRNKTDLEDQSLDDFLTALRSMSAVASVSAASTKISVSVLSNVDTLSNARRWTLWQMAMLTVRARRFLQRTRKSLKANGPTSIGFDMSKVECYNCHRKRHFARECQSPKDTRRNVQVEPQRRSVLVETSTSNALVSQCDGMGIYDWSFQAEEEPTNYALMAFTSSSSSSFNNEKMRIEQYFLMTDYSLWEVIINGDSPVRTRIVEVILQCQDTDGSYREDIWREHEDQESSKTFLKQQFENISGSHSESLDQIHDRLHKLVSQLKIHGVSLSQEDVNLNLKIYKAKVKHSSSTDTTTQNLSFVSSSNTDSNTDSVSAAVSVSAFYAKMHVSSLPNVYSLSNAGHFTRECRSSKDSRRNSAAEPQRRTVPVETSTSNALVSQCDGVGSYDWSYQAEEEPINYALMAFSSLRSSFDNELSLTKPEQALSHTHRPTTPIIEDWVSDSEDEFETKAPQLVPSFVQFSEQVKSLRNFVQHVTTTIPATTLKPASPNSANSGKRRNRKACFVCKSLDHLIKDCDYHAKKMAQPTPKNHAHRGFAGKMGMETKMPNSISSFSYHKCINDPKKGNPQHALKDNGVIDSGCSRYMTRNMSCLSDFEKLDGGYISFRGNPKGGNIFGKGKIKTGERYHAVPPPYIGTFMPPKPDFVFHDAPNVNETVHTAFNIELSPTKPDKDLSHRPSTPIIEDWFSNSEDDSEAELSQNAPILTKSKVVPLSAARPVTTAVLQPHGNPQHALKDKGVINSGCLRNMIGNMSYLSNFEEINGGYVAFGDVAFDGKELDFDAKKPKSEVNVSPSSSAQSRKQDDKTKKKAKGKIPTVGQNSQNSTNTFSDVGPSNAAASLTCGKSSFIDASQLLDDPDMPELEDITYSDDEDDVGAEADFNNLENSITVSPIPTTRVYKDHPVSQIIGVFIYLKKKYDKSG
nr:hypothetical protein [Tanacetum cinerariifolium]